MDILAILPDTQGGSYCNHLDKNVDVFTKAIYIRLADSTCLLVEVFLSDMIQVEVCSKI